jgi:hypothetical protein
MEGVQSTSEDFDRSLVENIKWLKSVTAAD